MKCRCKKHGRRLLRLAKVRRPLPSKTAAAIAHELHAAFRDGNFGSFRLARGSPPPKSKSATNGSSMHAQPPPTKHESNVRQTQFMVSSDQFDWKSVVAPPIGSALPCFNSTLVRLEANVFTPTEAVLIGFNSTLVRLEANRKEGAKFTATKFQFHTGSIRSV